MPSANRRSFVIAAIGLLVAAGLAWSFWPRPVAVETALVSFKPMQVDVSDEGRTRVRETYQISAPVNGKLLRVEVHPGDVVEAGKTKIVELLPIAPSFLDVRTRAQAEAGVKAAEAGRNLAAADLRRARAELTFAASELKRAQALGTSGFISKANLERAQLTRDTAAAQVATAQAALYAKNFELDSARALLLDPTDKAAQRAQQGVPIIAPVSGSVLHVLHESESVLQAGTVIADIGDPHQLEIVAELISEDAVKVHVGDKATITDWGGTVPLNARVRRIEPSGFTKLSALGVEEQRVNVLLDFTDPPARLNRVADGYRVVVHVTVWSAPRVLSVPVAALFRNGSGWAVFVLRNGHAALVPVTIDHSNDDIAEVRSGLGAGDAVVLHPSDRIADGTRISGRIP